MVNGFKKSFNLRDYTFFCSLIGHVESICEKLYDTPKDKVELAYGSSLQVNNRRVLNVDGIRYLRQGKKSSTLGRSDKKERDNTRVSRYVKSVLKKTMVHDFRQNISQYVCA